MQNWFDKECIDARRKTRSKLRKYRHCTEEADRLDYVIERRDYHKLIRKKKQTYKRKRLIIYQVSLDNLVHFGKRYDLALA